MKNFRQSYFGPKNFPVTQLNKLFGELVYVLGTISIMKISFSKPDDNDEDYADNTLL